MRIGSWFLIFLVMVSGCAVQRTFTPDAGLSGFDNPSGMDLQSGDEIEVHLRDGDIFAARFGGIEGDRLILEAPVASDIGALGRRVVPLEDIERVVCRKASAKESLVSVLFLVPAYIIVGFLLSGPITGLD